MREGHACTIVGYLKKIFGKTTFLPLSLEKGKSVQYRDFVTILWGASMQYIQMYIYYGDKNIWKHLSSIWRLFASHITLHTIFGNECLKLLLGVCNIKERGDLSISLIITLDLTHRFFEQIVTPCQFWTWYSADSPETPLLCVLRNTDEGAAVEKTGVLSGSRGCWWSPGSVSGPPDFFLYCYLLFLFPVSALPKENAIAQSFYVHR